MKLEVMYSSNTDQWATPQQFFDELNKEFNFTLDPCADSQNHKCEKYFTKEEDGLKQDWGGIVCFVTRRMVKQFRNGLKNVTEREQRKIQWLCC